MRLNAIAKSFCRKLLLFPKYIDKDLETLLSLKEIIVSRDATYELIRNISPWLQSVMQCQMSRKIMGRKMMAEMLALIVIRAPGYGDYQCVLHPEDIIYFWFFSKDVEGMLTRLKALTM